MSDSGPNLGVRGVGFLLVVVGLLLGSTGYRIRNGTSRIHVAPNIRIYAFAAFVLVGVVVAVLGATLLGVTG